LSRLADGRRVEGSSPEWRVVYETEDISEATRTCASDLEEIDSRWLEVFDLSALRRGSPADRSSRPLHPTTSSALTRFLHRPDRPAPIGPTEALLLSSAGTRLWMSDVQTCFGRCAPARESCRARAACRARMHDLRHSFAVRTLLDAYRTEGDPYPKIAALSTYLGHVNPSAPAIPRRTVTTCVFVVRRRLDYTQRCGEGRIQSAERAEPTLLV
jgi:hypothetical protein